MKLLWGQREEQILGHFLFSVYLGTSDISGCKQNLVEEEQFRHIQYFQGTRLKFLIALDLIGSSFWKADSKRKKGEQNATERHKLRNPNYPKRCDS